MKPPPKNFPRITPTLFYEDPAAAIDWLCKAFGFEVRLKAEEEGKIIHSELVLDGGVIMVEGARDSEHYASPSKTGNTNTQQLFVYVEDVDSLCESARAAGAAILIEPRVSDYGPEHYSDRNFHLRDPWGHRWWFAQRLRDPP
jgi:uncharacterized glyoxalase superfamily protein PhnB